jgi:hypothetical protein
MRMDRRPGLGVDLVVVGLVRGWPNHLTSAGEIAMATRTMITAAPTIATGPA